MTISRGYDAWTDNGHTHATHGSDDWLQVQTSTKRIFLWMPMPARMAGRTIASATLTAHAHGALVAQTFTVQAVSTQWSAGKLTYSNQPGVTGATAATTIGALSDGAEVTWDVTALVQAIANGTLKNYGWRVITNSSTLGKFASFNSGVAAWTLNVEFSEDPEAPSALAPNGTVVGAAKPVVSFDFSEYGADQTDLSQVRVEVDTNSDGTVDWDSGWLAATAPTLDLAAAGMTGTISAGQTVKWRASVQDVNGLQSPASAWASYTYQPLGTLTINSPAGGVIYDPTSEVLATYSGPSTLDSFLIEVTDGTDRTKLRYSSGKTQGSGTSIALELPLSWDTGTGFTGWWSRIFNDDGASYQIHVRAWDRLDRQATPGVPAHIDAWTTVVFNEDGALTPATSLTATQSGETPFVQLTWVDPTAPDAYILTRDGTQIQRLNPADVLVSGTTYGFLDIGASPAVQHTYAVRRLTTGVGRSPARTATITINPEGVWLLRTNGDYVVLDDDGSILDQLVMLERRLTYAPVNLPYGVDILTQYEGLSGPLVGSVQDVEDQTLAHAQSVLSAIKNNPNEIVQFIAASVSKPVKVSNLEVIPRSDWRGDQNVHAVRFNITQVGDFDYRLG